MKYYRVYFVDNGVDYAYTTGNLKYIIGGNKVKRIELLSGTKILKTYKNLDEILKGGRL